MTVGALSGSQAQELADNSEPTLSLTDNTPVEQVENLHEFLIELMKANTTYEIRAQKIPEQVGSLFDVHTISRIALGPYWKKMTDVEQLQIENLMQDLIVSNYAGRFKRYKKEAFVTQSEQPLSRNRHLVKTTLKTKTGEIVTLDYHFTSRNGEWKIYDVVANGVSDLALKRTFYGESYKKSGLVGVINDIQRQISKNQSL